MPKGYSLTAEAVSKLKRDHETLRLRVHELEAKAARAQSQVAIENMILAKITTQVSPRVTTTLGSGVADVQHIDQTTKAYANQVVTNAYGAASTTRSITVYNESIVPIPVKAVVRCTRDFKSGLWLVNPPQTAIGYAPTGVSARSEATLGTGTIDIYYRTEAGVLTDTGVNVAVYNLSDAAVGSGTYVMIKRNANYDNWYVDFAEC